MALMKCPDCGREVSDKARACPQCGRSLYSIRRNWPKEALALALLVGGIALGALLFIAVWLLVFGVLSR